MKRKLLKSAVLFAAIAAALSGCSFTNVVSQNLEGSKPTAQESTAEQSISIPELSFEEIDGRQYMRKAVNVTEKPEIIALTLSAECSGDIRHICLVSPSYVSPSYPGNVVVNNTVGLIGSPIAVSGSETLKKAVLTLEYDENALGNVFEDDLNVIYYSDEDIQRNIGLYNILYDAKTDEEKNTVTFDVIGDGYYVLIDGTKNSSIVEKKASKSTSAQDPTKNESAWERKNNTGDIMNLADKQWAVDNAPNFHVSTPEQLASVVYYTNAVAGSADEINIYLEDNIDLNNYEWAPIGWQEYAYLRVRIYGQGHTIRNLNINRPDESEVGITGDIRSFKASDLTVENASVIGKNNTGLFCGWCHGEKYFTNVKASGNVSGKGSNIGSFIGSGSGGNYIDCINDVKVNGVNVPYYSSEDQYSEENAVETAYTLTTDIKGDIHRTTLDKGSEYSYIRWIVVNENGGIVLERDARNETVFPMESMADEVTETGKHQYKIYISGWKHVDGENEGGYVRLSNMMEFTYELSESELEW